MGQVRKKVKTKSFRVDDAPTLEAFRKNAEKVWKQNHPDKVRKRGRPSHRTEIIDAIWRAELNGRFNENPTQGALLRAVQKELGYGPLSDKAKETEKAIRKYAKLWLILYRKHPTQLDSSALKLLAKQIPKVANLWRKVLRAAYRAEKTPVQEKGRKGVKIPLKGKGLETLRDTLSVLLEEKKIFLPSPELIKEYPALKHKSGKFKIPYPVPKFIFRNSKR